MKIKHLTEGFLKHSWDFQDDEEFQEQHKNEIIEFIENNCSKFINEFFKNDIPIFRGLDHVPPSDAYIVKSHEERDKTLGSVFSNYTTYKAFNDESVSRGNASRIHNVVLTTSSRPDEFDGIFVSAWFYFLPIGDYRYSYFEGVKDDINMNPNEHLLNFRFLSKTVSELKLMQLDLIEDLESYDKHWLNTDFNQFFSNEFIKNRDKYISLIKKAVNKINEIVDGLENIFNDNESIITKTNDLATILNYIKNDSLYKNLYHAFSNSSYGIEIKKGDKFALNFFTEEGIKSLLKKDRDVQDMAIHYISNLFYILAGSKMDYLSDNLDNKLQDSIKNVDNIFDSIVTDQITNDIKNNEIWFNCKEYVAIPHGTGNEYINEIINSFK